MLHKREGNNYGIQGCSAVFRHVLLDLEPATKPFCPKAARFYVALGRGVR